MFSEAAETLLVVYNDGKTVTINDAEDWGVYNKNTGLFYYTSKSESVNAPGGFIPIKDVLFFGPKKDYKDCSGDRGEVSDGYHTFNDLYDERRVLSAALFNMYSGECWKSRCHSDGKPCFDGGWFIVGINTPAGPYTYHYEDKYWDLFNVKVFDTAPEWDGHTEKDRDRLLSIANVIPCKTGTVIY